MIGKTIDVAELQKGGLLVSTPMFNQTATVNYIQSFAHLNKICGAHQINLGYNTATYPYVQVCRNILTDRFMQEPEYTHQMFIDADIGFDPVDVLYLKYIMTDDSPYDIIGAAYPKKSIDWAMVRDAALSGVGKDNPSDLANYTSAADRGGFVTTINTTIDDINEPCEVDELGTGFMMIKKSALEKFRDSYPEYKHWFFYTGDRDITQYFHCEILDKQAAKGTYKVYESEDYWFCRKSKEIGLKVWICPWMKLTHFGNHLYTSNMIDTQLIHNNKLQPSPRV